mmetsp:Transcript_16536/g.52722  ORF Transcript_16536/g.52722 Transcript_16536/m.52722 type:complete len:246 (+) Transcript_16536:128-865(+)
MLSEADFAAARVGSDLVPETAAEASAAEVVEVAGANAVAEEASFAGSGSTSGPTASKPSAALLDFADVAEPGAEVEPELACVGDRAVCPESASVTGAAPASIAALLALASVASSSSISIPAPASGTPSSRATSTRATLSPAPAPTFTSSPPCPFIACPNCGFATTRSPPSTLLRLVGFKAAPSPSSTRPPLSSAPVPLPAAAASALEVAGAGSVAAGVASSFCVAAGASSGTCGAPVKRAGNSGC